DERQIKEMNEESKDPKKKRVVNETPREEDTIKVPAEQEVTEQGTKKRKSGHVKMIARKRPRPHQDDDSDDEHIKCLRIVTLKKHEVKQVQHSCLREDCWELCIPDLVPLVILVSTASCSTWNNRRV
ncbi:hypothetical protein Tco_0253958, partial [Tanacetum coccineum]